MDGLNVRFARNYLLAANRKYPDLIAEVRAGSDADLYLFVLMRNDDRALRKRLMELAWDVAYDMDLRLSPRVHVTRASDSERHDDRGILVTEAGLTRGGADET